MESIIVRQKEIIKAIEQLNNNFKKDSSSRKTSEYIATRLERIDKLFDDFRFNHEQLQTYTDRSHEYFVKNMYEQLKDFYEGTRKLIASYNTGESSTRQHRSIQPDEKVLELTRQQSTNFRALQRMVDNCNNNITEKWELEDKLRNLQSKWEKIDSLHWQIDNILGGSDDIYEEQYTFYENMYENTKKNLNIKLLSTAHMQQSTPKLEIPIFSGNYTQWPTFRDLFGEAIHKNPSLSKSQKMQHLKGKLRGEAEKLIQHLNITSENYDTAWSIINQRYNNHQLLFSKQIEAFLNQPSVQKQSSPELKRLHDISTETINAIKNLGIDISSWGPILVHLICKKLDPETLCDYQESRKFPRELATFQELMKFLETKFMALEPVSRKLSESYKKSSSSNSQSVEKRDMNKTYNYHYSKPNYNRAYHTSFATTKCPICNNNHALFQCKKFGGMSLHDKQNALSKYKICNNCLYVHERNICNSTKVCKKCHQAHNTLLHDVFVTTDLNTSQQKHRLLGHINHVQNNYDEILLTTVQLKVKTIDGQYLTLRGLLDQGSQSTLVTENAIQRLGLQRQHFNASVSGVGTLSNKVKGKVELVCKSVHDGYEFTTEALIMPKIINSLPSQSFEKINYVHLQNLKLADPDYNISNQIDILFDAKIYSDILMDGLQRGLPEQPIAQKTKLGWILSGYMTKTFNCHVIINDQENISRFWDMEDISDNNCNELTKDEQFCEELYTSTTKRLSNGKYVVRLPMKPNFQEYLGASKGKAIAQLKSLEQKFNKNNDLYRDYNKFIKEYEDLGHMKECKASTDERACYLPHHDVHKQDSTTTKLRVVFNASAKTSSGNSLNDLMETGPKLQKDIQELLIQWRSFKYVYSADCEKMYRMILVHYDDQNLQKIVWRNNCEDIMREYKLCTLTYGIKASPYLALRTLQQLAHDEAENFPLAAKVLKNNFYVDDLLAGSNDINAAKQVQMQLIRMLASAGFNLRKWCSNAPELLQDLNKDQVEPSFIEFKYPNSTKTLGLRWDAETDSFQFQFHFDKNIKNVTKRQMLSQISRIYDPLGWLSPLTIKAKLQFQRVWSTGIHWDETISSKMQDELIVLLNDLDNIDMLTLPRWLGCSEKNIELHGFSDASEKVYACSVYLRSQDHHGKITSRLIAAKTKLAPVTNKVTLPKLELCAAELLTKLVNKIKNSLPYENIKVFGWTDSMITLGWICGDISRWKTFVANRVKYITNVIPATSWHHTRSEHNAADCATRGLTAPQLKKYAIWWEGPHWLQNQELDIQPRKIEFPELECKNIKQINVIQLNSSAFIKEILNKYSTMTRAIRVLSWVSRFITNARNKNGRIKCNYLITKELESSRLFYIKYVQMESFENEMKKLRTGQKISTKSNILTLNPFIDKYGIMRVGGRLQQSSLTYDSKHPILIPHDSHLTNLLIIEAHRTSLHGGPSLTLTYLRQKYWIVGGMRVVKKQLRQCVVCRRYSRQKMIQQMANLPEPRISPTRPFTHTGIDFTGYIDIKANKGRGIKTTKGYIAVFVCFCTKAIHLELVSDLSTPTFLAAFKRMCARRGVPKHVYSDNGTNFVGASRILKQQYRSGMKIINKEFLDDISHMQVTWHFNAPLWPSAGGLWEAAVKSVKYHLKRIIGEQKLTFEEFYTLLTQIEACLNSRPLYRLTENIEDGYLTPGHFLIGAPLLAAPFSDGKEIASLTTRWQLIERMQKSFWKKWSTEYLQQLHARYKWQHPTASLNINDIVLVNEEYLPPSKWALAKVHEVHPGRDGHVRVVTLKTTKGFIKRPVIKLTPLLKEDQSLKLNDKGETNINTSRRIRYKKPNCLLTMLFVLFMCLVPSYQQINITTLPTNSTLYFEPISDLRIIQDDWKMILYYNMSSYWEAVSNVEIYISYLKEFCAKKKENKYDHIIIQLEHELLELKHYNDMMIITNKPRTRSKRGLINGIGYVGNYLFGVLDDRFAERYEKDITIIKENENHLFNMLKNQTSILEAENNVLKRNEAIMTKQFIVINEHLISINQQIDTLNHIIFSFDIMASSLSINMILSSLRRTQETLMNIVTNIYHGRVDLHLLSPNQLQNQLNLISTQIHEELIIPVDDVRDLYQLLRIHVKMTKKYLIMECKIPLLYRDVFELDKIISIPWIKGNRSLYNIPSANYIAFNIKKDIFMPLTDIDIQNCLKYKEERLLCSENHPIYNINMGKSICDIQLLKTINNDKHRYCRTDLKKCDDAWIKLRRPGAWLYSCCKKCTVRILCKDSFVTKQLTGNGIINIEHGCMLKGDDFTIHAQYDYKNQLFINNIIDSPYLSQIISPLNKIINTTISEDILKNLETHETVYSDIARQIKELKSQDINHTQYSVSHNITIYSILTIITIIVVAFVASKIVRWRNICRATPGDSSVVAPTADVIEMQSVSSSRINVDKATSPGFTRAVKFDNLSDP